MYAHGTVDALNAFVRTLAKALLGQCNEGKIVLKCVILRCSVYPFSMNNV